MKDHFLAWGSDHVGKMGSASRSSSHNSAIHRTKTWAGKSPDSSEHRIRTTGGGNAACFVFVLGEELVLITVKGEIMDCSDLKKVRVLQKITLSCLIFFFLFRHWSMLLTFRQKKKKVRWF